MAARAKGYTRKGVSTKKKQSSEVKRKIRGRWGTGRGSNRPLRARFRRSK